MGHAPECLVSLSHVPGEPRSVCWLPLPGRRETTHLHQTICTRPSQQVQDTCMLAYKTPTLKPTPQARMAVVISPEECWPWPPSAQHLQAEDVVSSSGSHACTRLLLT